MIILHLLVKDKDYVNISDVITNCDFERCELTLSNNNYQSYISIPLKNVIDFTVVDVNPQKLKYGVETLYVKNIITLEKYIKGE